MDVPYDVEKDLERIRRRLAEFYEPHQIDKWLRSPQTLLGGRTACELIAEGRAAEVEQLLDQIDDPPYA